MVCGLQYGLVLGTFCPSHYILRFHGEDLSGFWIFLFFSVYRLLLGTLCPSHYILRFRGMDLSVFLKNIKYSKIGRREGKDRNNYLVIV